MGELTTAPANLTAGDNLALVSWKEVKLSCKLVVYSWSKIVEKAKHVLGLLRVMI